MVLKLGSRGNEVKLLQEKLNLKVDGIFGPLTEEDVKNSQRYNVPEVDVVGCHTTLGTGQISLTKSMTL